MNNLFHDQAEGLRRMFSAPKPRIITVLTNLPDAEKDMLLVNLGVSVARVGSEVLLVDARLSSTGIAGRNGNSASLSLAEAIRENVEIEKVVFQIPQGCPLITLVQKWESLNAINPKLLAQAFESVTCNARIILIDGEIAKDDSFPLLAMESGEIVLQLSAKQESVKSAYLLLKRLSARLGRRPFSILITGSNEQEAKMVSQNLIETANRYLGIPLTSLGWVPSDSHLDQAARLGKSVVDAFPLAGAAMAFKQIAENLVSV